MEIISADIKKFEQDLPAGIGRDLLTGQAFITFETQEDARAVELKYGREWAYRFWNSTMRSLFCCRPKIKLEKFKDKKIYARLANEPNDIFWENLEVSSKDRILNTVKTSIFTLLTVSVTFGIVYGMKILGEKERNSSSDNSSTIRILSIWPSIIIIIINFVLSRSTRISTSYERPHSMTAYNISVTIKLMLAMFFNTAVIALIVNYDWYEDWFVPGGLATDATYILISNAIISPLLYYYSPMVCIYKLRMKKVEKAAYISQHDANLLMESPPADMAQRYANIGKTILLTFCYAPLVPAGFFFSAVAVFFEYWMFKYLLLRRHSWPKKLSGDLAKAMMNVIPWSVLLYSVMNFVYMNYLNPEESNLAFIWMLMMIIYTVLPLEIFISFCGKTDLNVWKNFDSQKYDDVALNFVEDYDKLNPITSSEGHKRFAELMLKKQVVNQEQYEKIKNVFMFDESDVFKNMKNYAKGRENVQDIEKKKLSLGLNRVDKASKRQKNKLKQDPDIDIKEIIDLKVEPNLKKVVREEKMENNSSGIYPNMDGTYLSQEDMSSDYRHNKPGPANVGINQPRIAQVNNYLPAQVSHIQYPQNPRYPQYPEYPQIYQYPNIPPHHNYGYYSNPLSNHPAHNYNSYNYYKRNYW
jgi:hypothetical protein